MKTQNSLTNIVFGSSALEASRVLVLSAQAAELIVTLRSAISSRSCKDIEAGNTVAGRTDQIQKPVCQASGEVV